MRLFFMYLKQKRRTVLTGFAFALLFAVSFFLYRLPVQAVLYPALLCAALGAFLLVLDFRRVKREHEALTRIQTITDAKAAFFPPDETIQNADYREIIRLLCEEHAAFQTETNRRYEDMTGYYTVWAHQIKTPIASMRLTLQNEDSVLARKLTGDLFRVEQYAEMVLTYLRLDAGSTDYVFRTYDLDSIVKDAVKKFSSEFIGRKLRLVYAPLHTAVVTDEKWLSFVIEQVLSNALKYTPSGSITISLAGKKTLRIADTGIGIAPSDLPRIFENGYTGFNGRIDKRASGLGLYLCRRICDQLGHTISASSVIGEGTAIEIDLAQAGLEPE